MALYAGMLKVNDSFSLLVFLFSNASGIVTMILFQCSRSRRRSRALLAYVPSVHRGASWLVFDAGFCSTSLHAKGDVARRSCGAFYSISILWCGFAVRRFVSVGIVQFTASNHLFILLKKAAPSPRSRPRIFIRGEASIFVKISAIACRHISAVHSGVQASAVCYGFHPRHAGNVGL